MGEMITFPIWINPFHFLKINFELLGENDIHLVKEVGEMIIFPVLKIDYKLLGKFARFFLSETCK